MDTVTYIGMNMNGRGEMESNGNPAYMDGIIGEIFNESYLEQCCETDYKLKNDDDFIIAIVEEYKIQLYRLEIQELGERIGEKVSVDFGSFDFISHRQFWGEC